MDKHKIEAIQEWATRMIPTCHDRLYYHYSVKGLYVIFVHKWIKIFVIVYHHITRGEIIQAPYKLLFFLSDSIDWNPNPLLNRQYGYI